MNRPTPPPRPSDGTSDTGGVSVAARALLSAIHREPFRLLFPLGILCGMLGVGHWLAYALGVTSRYSGLMHATLQMQAYMTCFVAGFLMTALPRFTASPTASPWEVWGIVTLVISQVIGALQQRWMVAQGCFVGMLIALAVFAGRRVMRRRTEVHPPTEFVWIPVAVMHGIVGSALAALGATGVIPPWWSAAGRPMAQQGFLLSIVLGVGGFMAPRLMGHGELVTLEAGYSAAEISQWRRRRIRRHLIAALGLFGSFWLEGGGALRWAYALRAVIVVGELGWTARLARRPRTPDLYVQLLWISLWLMALGEIGAAVWICYRVEALHLVFLGGFSLMTFAVATMVIFSHAGHGERLRRRMPWLRFVAVGIGVSLCLRLSAAASPSHYFAFLGAAAVCWLLAAIVWLVRVLPSLCTVPAAETFERMHEDAKRRLLDTQRSASHSR